MVNITFMFNFHGEASTFLCKGREFNRTVTNGYDQIEMCVRVVFVSSPYRKPLTDILMLNWSK